ncbi:hypothetical protein EGH25_02700 [Haladaptatus sp. F3-133]|uniref:Uncharacterized protein n=1 Tax=Halorutilus salinus TaxID=2487751 RepID=A0A9Q4C399_9EURY|nr:hypothetical protein [Halorutilus salinus]MCX2818261.1 hypothetical protein [Halorutilus salinus]
MESPYQLVFLAQAFVLALTAVLVVYPLAAYARNVAYTEAFVLLALAFFTVTVVGVVDFVLGYRTLANALRPVGALFALAGVYLFARDFVRANDSLETYGDFGDYVEFGGEEGD